MKDQAGSPRDVIPPSHLDLLQQPTFAHIATVRRDGAPQCCPIWFEWDGTWIKMTNVKTRLRYRNIRREPRVVEYLRPTKAHTIG